MARTSAVNLSITPNTVGYTIGGGITTVRSLTIAGPNSDITLTSSNTLGTNFTIGSGSATATVDVLVGASAWSSAGTILYGSTGSAAGTSLPTALTPGAQGTYLQVGASSALQWSAINALTWQVVSTATTAVMNAGYLITGATAVTVTLPTSVAGDIGKLIAVGSAKGGTGGWTIAQPALATIQFGSVSTIAGIGGSISSNNVGDLVTLMCTGANQWLVISSVGNITYV